jgi:hypothetical protein
VPEPLPDNWRARLVEMIRGAAPPDAAWFTGGPVCTPAEQLGIYLDQYRLRLYDALVEEVPGLSWLLGDDREAVLRHYLADHPSRSWTLNRVADALPDWLAGAADATPARVDMARLDRAIQAGFEAADAPALAPEALFGLPDLRLRPAVRLLRLRTNVHDVRAAVLTGAAPPPTEAADVWLVVFRRGVSMRTLALEPGAWTLLDALDRGLPTRDAIDEAARVVDPATLLERLPAWFRDFVALELVCLAEPLTG